MDVQDPNARCLAALNKLCKWRSLLVGWQVGTKAADAPGLKALRDQADARLVARAELSALVGLLIRKGVITEAEWLEQLREEAQAYDAMLADKFKGYTTSDAGLVIFDAAAAAETNRRLGFPD